MNSSGAKQAGALLAGIVSLGMLTAATTVNADEMAAEKHPFAVKGLYAETCSCHAPCPCELVGVKMGCEGVGLLRVDSGSYNGKDMSGSKIALALQPGDWVRVYIDAPNPEKFAAAKEFAGKAFAAFGKVESVKEAKVDVGGKDGNYTVSVDGGKVMSYQTEAVLGGDGKTPIAHTNTKNGLSPTMMQGLGVSCTYSDGDHKFTNEKGRNAYFNENVDAKGDI